MFWNLFVRFMGRKRAWRVGRRLYMAARGELANDMATNGESALVRACVAAHVRIAKNTPFIAFDVGANLGRWTEIMLETADQFGVDCRVEMFEPVPGAIERLDQKYAGEDRARLHRLALSDQSGTAEMKIVGEFAGTNSLSPSIRPDAQALLVEISTFDEMRNRLDIGEVSLVKIDAEGHDLAILRGMAQVVAARAVRVIQFEYNWRWLMSGSSLYQVFELVKEAGYSLGRITADGVELIASWSPELDRYFEANYVLVRQDWVEMLNVHRAVWDDSNVLSVARSVASA